jgi:hypothetical protein
MPYLVGVVLALAVSLFATLSGFDRDRAFYPTVMIVIASYYVLFAVMGGSGRALTVETAIMVVFIAACVAGFKRSLWIVALALAAHGALDSVHGRFVANPGVPSFWPAFCLAYDFVAAGYLGWLLMRTPRAATAAPRGESR